MEERRAATGKSSPNARPPPGFLMREQVDPGGFWGTGAQELRGTGLCRQGPGAARPMSCRGNRDLPSERQRRPRSEGIW